MSRKDDCGRCEDFYFDSVTWKVRYLLGNDGGLFFKKQYLLAPDTLDIVELESCVHGIPLRIGREQIESTPAYETRLPLSRKIEREVHAFHNWTPYWLDDFASENSDASRDAATKESEEIEVATIEETGRTIGSLMNLLGLEFCNASSSLGIVEDLIVDVSDFSIQYIAIDTKPSEKGGLRLVATADAENQIKIDWDAGRVWSELSVCHLLESPSADLSDGRLSLGDQRKIRLSSF